MAHSATPQDSSVTAWSMLTLGVSSQVVGTFLVLIPTYLIPMLHVQMGMSLAAAGLLAAVPTMGKVLALVAWGALADRIGERWVIAGGLALAAVFVCIAALSGGFLWVAFWLMLTGAASASTDAASGRVIVGWFPRQRRGFAMGIRQTAQPVGVALSALLVPPIAARFGTPAPLFVGSVAAIALAAVCAVLLRSAPGSLVKPAVQHAQGQSAPTKNPYRRSSFLARIHIVSALLVFPQFTLVTFSLVWLTVGLGWNQTIAGIVVALSQFVGAAGRIVIGALSDRLGERVRVIRWIALSCVSALLFLAIGGATGWAPLIAVMVITASMISVADNGLAFTSVAEAAGPAWSGKALGVQNTGQYIAASMVGPVVGGLIGLVGYPFAFALVSIAPIFSWPLIPPRDEHWDEHLAD